MRTINISNDQTFDRFFTTQEFANTPQWELIYHTLQGICRLKQML